MCARFGVVMNRIEAELVGLSRVGQQGAAATYSFDKVQNGLPILYREDFAKISLRSPTRRDSTGACLHGPWQPVFEIGIFMSSARERSARSDVSKPVLAQHGCALQILRRYLPSEYCSLALSRLPATLDRLAADLARAKINEIRAVQCLPTSLEL